MKTSVDCMYTEMGLEFCRMAEQTLIFWNSKKEDRIMLVGITLVIEK